MSRTGEEPLRNLRILYVEDDPIERETLSKLLKQYAGEVLEAEDGRRGLDLFMAIKPDIVITDIGLPGIDGLQMAKEIKRTNPSTPIILITGSDDTGYLINAIEIGVDRYVMKPFEISRLLDGLNFCAGNIYQKRRIDELNGQLKAQNRELAEQAAYMELVVSERTAQIMVANELLTKEIEERRMAETQRRQSEELLRKLIDVVRDFAIFLLDKDGRIDTWNSGARQIIGYREEEIIGKHLSCLYSRDELNAGMPSSDLDKAVSEGRYETKGWRYRKDGSPFWANVIITVITDSGGQLLGFSHITQDFSDRKRAEAKIERLERLYSVLISINEALVRIHTRDELFREVCRIATHRGLFRMAWIGITDKATSEVVPVAHSGHEDGYLKLVDISLKDETRSKGPTGLAIRSCGHFVCNDIETNDVMIPWRQEALKRGYYSSAAFSLKVSGRCIGAMTFYASEKSFFDMREVELLDQLSLDISFALEFMEQEEHGKKLQEQLSHSRKMEAVGQLAGGIAHDFNNILSAILGYCHVIHNRPDVDAFVRRYVEQILASARRAANLTQGLLAYSRKQVVNPMAVDLNDIIRNVQKLVMHLIGEDVEVAVNLTNEKLIVYTDVTQIEQVVMNLCTNARDALPKGGTITIETNYHIRTDCGPRIRQPANPANTADGSADAAVTKKSDDKSIPSTKFSGHYALLSVSDTGTGIDKTLREKIFEPFFTTKEVGKGTGLGLSIVYGIVEQNNGYIEVDSIKDQGSIFRVYLPICNSEVEKCKQDSSNSDSRGTETILVAEDDNELRGLAREILEDSGYKVIEASNGQDGVNAFIAHRDEIKMVIFDVIMPKKNGKDAYDEIRALRPNVKALFTSGYAFDFLQKKGAVNDEWNFMSKPVQPIELLRKIREILDNQTPTVKPERGESRR
ncbi:MAG: response regulator [Nitrospirae bacterium]|nr:response regulator [Nitrospirota bacterium]